MRIFCGTVRKIRDKKIRNPKAGKEGKGEQKKTERRPGEKDKRGKLTFSGFPFIIKHILLKNSGVIPEFFREKSVDLVPVRLLAAEIFAVELFHPGVHGKGAEIAESEQRDAIGDLIPYTRVCDERLFQPCF